MRVNATFAMPFPTPAVRACYNIWTAVVSTEGAHTEGVSVPGAYRARLHKHISKQIQNSVLQQQTPETLSGQADAKHDGIGMHSNPPAPEAGRRLAAAVPQNKFLCAG